MSTKYPNLTAAQESLFLTLAGRALDSRLPRPFLGDVTSDTTMRELGYDPSVFRILSTDLRDPRNKVFELAVRAKRLDEIVRRFVARHPDAVVLDLGAGLDNRMHRIGTPPGVDWYDVDFPEVIALRQRALPQPANAHPVAIDLRTDQRWLDELPADQPAVIVADGLIPFLSQAELVTLLGRLTRHFPDGELAVNGYYTPLAVWAIKHLRIAGSLDAGAAVNPGFFDPHEPERWGIGLQLIEEIAIARAPEVADLPPVNRLVHRLAGRVRPVSRLVATVVLHYRLQRDDNAPGPGDRTVQVERLIDAPRETIFDVLADPRRHAELDGSGMVHGAARAPDRLGLGAEFHMDMRQRFDYRSVSTVVEYEQDRVLAWETTGRWRGRKVIGGQWWRYRLIPQGTRTLVQHSYLWGRASLPLLTVRLPGFPRRMAPAMRETLQHLAAATERPAQRPPGQLSGRRTGDPGHASIPQQGQHG